MRDIILARLAELEASEAMRIVYACESGSRAWGFASADSDYDVRFLYVRPAEWYLSILERRDVIELPIDDALDITGWDLRKALQLFRKSNTPLMEWLGSPVVYLERGGVAEQLRGMREAYYSPLACAHHYLNMARGAAEECVRGERVRLKKCFYALRPLLAIQWIERGWGVAPTEFGALVDGLALGPELRAGIARLLEIKRAAGEVDSGPRIAAVSDFIAAELARLEAWGLDLPAVAAPAEPLDALFRRAVGEMRGA
jgi:predicted nucleotidyltransferase